MRATMIASDHQKVSPKAAVSWTAHPVSGDQPGVINTGGARTGLVLKESLPGPSLVGRIIRLN
ncbi:MAG TPA: hypothetical protein VNW94_24905 [Streptosporangiaceae bacterium]|nr:hypothetical protein [Streptosporangiaceae bacterium]